MHPELSKVYFDYQTNKPDQENDWKVPEEKKIKKWGILKSDPCVTPSAAICKQMAGLLQWQFIQTLP